MIKFVPKADNISAKGSKDIADYMNQKYLGLYCKLHPKSESIILVEVQARPMYEIELFVASIFRSKLKNFLVYPTNIFFFLFALFDI